VNDIARRLWTVAEPLHALTYFAPESHDAFAAAGLRGFWRGYFAGRAAPLGPVGPGVVTATFFGFHPAFVGRAIPSVWSIVSPDDAITARLAGVAAALPRIIGRDAPSSCDDAIAQLSDAVTRTPAAGRPLYAANAGLDWPEDQLRALWHAATLLREHRGDGHVHALAVAGLDACEAHVLRIADDSLPIESIQPYRGWSATDWEDATQRLEARGLLAAGRTTPDGHAVRATVEAETDRLSAVLVDRIAEPDVVLRTFGSVARAIAAAGDVPYPNPIGVPDAFAAG
jgi:hypothetical protein